MNRFQTNDVFYEISTRLCIIKKSILWKPDILYGRPLIHLFSLHWHINQRASKNCRNYIQFGKWLLKVMY